MRRSESMTAPILPQDRGCKQRPAGMVGGSGSRFHTPADWLSSGENSGLAPYSKPTFNASLSGRRVRALQLQVWHSKLSVEAIDERSK